MPADETLDAADRQGLEALLFLADEPLEVAALAELFDADPEAVEATLHELATEFAATHRGMEIRPAAGGWRMYSAPGAHGVVERWALTGRTGRLTQAALETLAVIAYKQPIGRQEVSDIRGVNADGAVRSLVARGFVEEVGRDPGPGQAALFGTTRLFLERLGLGSLQELPPLTEFLPEAPAPDEPDLSALKEVRRRLAAGGELPVRGEGGTVAPDGSDGDAEVAATAPSAADIDAAASRAAALLGGRTAAQTNTGTGDDEPLDDEDDLLPPPALEAGTGRGDAAIDALTEQLERAARNAVDRLRAAVSAGERDAEDETETDADAATEPAAQLDGEDDRG